jgi:hypothetical protein
VNDLRQGREGVVSGSLKQTLKALRPIGSQINHAGTHSIFGSFPHNPLLLAAFVVPWVKKKGGGVPSRLRLCIPCTNVHT